MGGRDIGVVSRSHVGLGCMVLWVTLFNVFLFLFGLFFSVGGSASSFRCVRVRARVLFGVCVCVCVCGV